PSNNFRGVPTVTFGPSDTGATINVYCPTPPEPVALCDTTKKDFPPIVRPDRPRPSIARDWNARAWPWIRLQVHLVPSRFIRGVRDPLTIRGPVRKPLVIARVRPPRLECDPSALARQHPDLAAGRGLLNEGEAHAVARPGARGLNRRAP